MALSSVTALPNTTGKTAPPASDTSEIRVKQERPDDAEINELAAKMVEANKAKMAQAARVPGMQSNVAAAGQGSILGYLNRGTAGAKTTEKKAGGKDDKAACDEESQRGKFGWVTLGKCHIPYIFRYGEKYCAVRMVEMKLLNKYLSYLHSDIYSCTCIRSYYITEWEAKLLNEINLKHCEGQFGRELFTVKDLVVRLQDAGEFYTFLDTCYNKLLLSSCNPKDKCGFIRINGESVVPYTIREGLKYVPLFYFEGETDNLKLKAEKLEGWNLAYLKFCCKVQGIRNELFASDTCSVISLFDIKSYFPAGTSFEDYWPSKVVDSQLLLSSKGGVTNNKSAGMWTKQPPQQPQQPQSQQTQHKQPVTNKVTQPTGSAIHQQQVANKLRNQTPAQTQPQQRVQQTIQATPVSAPQPVVNGAWPSGLTQTFQPGQIIRMAQAPITMQNMVPNTNVRAAYNPVRPRTGHQYYPQSQVSLPSHIPQQAQPHMTAAQPHLPSAQPPPPLVRGPGPTHNIGAAAAAAYTASTGLSLPNVSPNSLHLMGLDPARHPMLPPQHSPHYTQQVQRHTPSPSSAKYPPPLIPNGSTPRYQPQPAGGVYNSATPISDIIDLSSPPQSPHRSAVGNGRASSTGSNSSDVSGSSRKLIAIQETVTSGSHIPYQVQKALVEGKMVPCINSKPFIYSELLMTLPDLISHFFPSISLNNCTQVLQDVLGLDLYKGNREQTKILFDSGKCQSLNDTLPLVQVRDVMQFMPQMKYMFRSMSGGDESAAKRPRIS